MDTLNSVYEKNSTTAPTVVFVMQGTFQNNSNTSTTSRPVFIQYPMAMIGAGRNKTILSGYILIVEGTKEKEKRVVLKDMTMMGGSSGNQGGNGLFVRNGLSFLCDSMTFTQCRGTGVFARNTKGRLINCEITQCYYNGIYSSNDALIEMEGDQTKVHGNCTSGVGFGLKTFDTSSRIHLLFPLTKESVSTNNGGGNNYGGEGTIVEFDE